MRLSISIGIGLIGLMLTMVLPAQAALCPACKGVSYTKELGDCSHCKEGPTTSGQFKLCGRCSTQLAQCEHCRKPLQAASSQPTSRPVSTDQDGSYTEGRWEYQFRVNNRGTRSEGTTGELLYQGQAVAEPDARNDFYQTPWGPMYWVGRPVVAWGPHGWMPKPRGRDPAGRQLPDPAGAQAADLRLWVRVVMSDRQAVAGVAPLETWVEDELKKLNVSKGVARSDWEALDDRFLVLEDSRHYGQLQVRTGASKDPQVLVADFGGAESQVQLPRRAGATRLVHVPLQSSIARLDLYLAFKVEAAPVVRKVTLSSCFATSGQEGLQQVDDGPFAGNATPLAMAFGWASDFRGLSGDSMTAAQRGERMTLSQAAEGQLWVAIHLGTSGGSPPQFVLDSVTFPKDGQIEVAYRRTRAVPMTKDVHQYRVWIPLGRLAPGSYLLRIVSEGRAEAEQTIVVGQPAGR